MTATLLGKLVDDGKLAWSTTLSDLFPATEFKLDSGYRSVTVEQLLAHRAGCPASGWPPGMQISDVRALVGTPREQRRSYARRLLAKPPETPPGTRYLYSNASFALAGIIAEQVMGQAYETLMAEHLFKPLGMTGVGFGAMGTPGRVDQPWQHRLKGEQLEPIGPGPTSDNPPSIAPAGTVHCTLADWARFARLHVDGETDGGGLLSVSTCKRLHRAPAGGTYGGGWIVTDRPWAGGRALTHGGSNTQNYAILWVAPARRFAAMAVTNVGGGNRPFQVCDRVISGLVRRYLS
jgi:CubicO group peptidase (beta-lactamase class C family)